MHGKAFVEVLRRRRSIVFKVMYVCRWLLIGVVLLIDDDAVLHCLLLCWGGGVHLKRESA